MYEKNETDFSINLWEDYNGDKKIDEFSVSIGTWQNINQHFVDCLFYLTLNKGKKERFYEKLKGYQHFLERKEEMYKPLREKGLNIWSIVNERELNDTLRYHNETEIIKEEEKQQKEIRYKVDKSKLISFINDNYVEEVIKILKQNNDIIELYEELQDLKRTIKEEVRINILQISKTQVMYFAINSNKGG